MTAIADISSPRNAPNSPSAPGDATRLTPTAANRATLRSGNRAARMPDASITRSARDLRCGQHDDRVAGADQPVVHLAAHFLGDDMRIDGVLDHGRADEQDQLGPGPLRVLVGERIADAGDRIQQRNALPHLVRALPY